MRGDKSKTGRMYLKSKKTGVQNMQKPWRHKIGNTTRTTTCKWLGKDKRQKMGTCDSEVKETQVSETI